MKLQKKSLDENTEIIITARRPGFVSVTIIYLGRPRFILFSFNLFLSYAVNLN